MLKIIKNDLKFYICSCCLAFIFGILYFVVSFALIRTESDLLCMLNYSFELLYYVIFACLIVFACISLFRRNYFKYVVLFLLCLLTYKIVPRPVWFYQKQYYWDITEIATPIVDSIELYIDEYGDLPVSLNELSPKYIGEQELIDTINNLGIQYKVAEYYGNNWTLVIPLDSKCGELQKIKLVYFPEKNYIFKQYERNGWGIVFSAK